MQNMTQAELQVGIKEKENEVLSHSDSYCKETDSLSIINMKNLQQLNCLGKETDNSVLLKREGDSFWTTSELEHSKVVHHCINDRESGGRDSPDENDLGEVLYNHGARDSRTDEENRDKVLNGSEFDCMIAPNDHANCDEHELPVSGTQIITSKLLLTDSNLYTDKNVMECEMPQAQVIVCCKDIDCQHVKDICVDKGEPLEEKCYLEKRTDNFVGRHVSNPSSDYGTNKTSGDLDCKIHIPDGLRPQAQEDFSNLTVDRCEAKEERKVTSPVLCKSEYALAGKLEENGLSPEVFMQANEKDVGNKIEKYVLVEEAVVTTMLPLEKFGTSVPQSFKDLLNGQGDEVARQSDQSMKVNPKSPDAELESEESNQNDADRITLDFCYEPTAVDSMGVNDEVCGKSWKEDIVPNHDYRDLTDPLVAHVVEHANMDERDKEHGLNHELRRSNNPFLVSELQSSGTDGSVVDTHHEPLLTNMEVHSTNPFGVEVQSAIVEVSTEEILATTILNHKENFNPFALTESGTPSSCKDTENIYVVPAECPKRWSTNNPFADSEVENVGMDKNCERIDQQPANDPFDVSEVHSSSDAKGIQHSNQQPERNPRGNSYNPFTISDIEGAGIEDKISGDTGTETGPKQLSFELRDLHNHEGAHKNVPLIDHGEAGIGQTSFSAVSGRITYSGPISISGSTSLRSDSSTTSTRSFAFPVLQSEWNSSPVRMERADRRKQRGGWKHGILCCCKF